MKAHEVIDLDFRIYLLSRLSVEGWLYICT